MQIINSLMNLQKAFIKPGQKATDALDVANERIAVIASVHELVYQSKDFQKICLKDLAQKVFDQSRRKFPGGLTLPLKTNFPENSAYITLENAAPIGLIIHEIFCNSFRHGKVALKDGSVFVRLSKKGACWVLTVGDDGVGLSPGASLERMEGLGYNLIKMLSKQCGWQMKTYCVNGIVYEFIFE